MNNGIESRLDCIGSALWLGVGVLVKPEAGDLDLVAIALFALSAMLSLALIVRAALLWR